MNKIARPFDFQFDQGKVEDLCQDKTWDSPEIYEGNDAFGLASIFKEYASLPNEYPLRLTLEHGLKFDDNPSMIAWKTDFHAVLTPSKIRTPVIEQEPGKRSIPIGFGFLYAKKLFQKFGLAPIPDNVRKGTLVFPFKSTPLTTVHFDHASYTEKLNSLPKRFQPVYVCIYWADINKGLARIYDEAGIPVVTAGHRYDPLFFYRFYDLCRRFRYAASNDIGTNLFLSVHSGCRFFYLDGEELKREVSPGSKIDDRVGSTFEKTRGESRRLFAAPVEETTAEQQAFVDAFLGTENLLTPRKLRRLLLREQRLFEKRPWWHGEKRLLAPPDASSFAWEKPVPCRGWYSLETDGDTTFRWMGLTDDAWIELGYPCRSQKRGAMFSCRIHCLAGENLEITINGKEIADLERTVDGVGFRLEGAIQSDVLTKPLAKNTVRVGFHVSGANRPRDSDPDNPEIRHLGAAISHISLRPNAKDEVI